MISLPPLQQRAMLFRTESSHVPCFFGPQEDNFGDDTSSPSTSLLRPLAVFVLWQLLAHAPFQLIGSAFAAALYHPVEANAVPMYGIDPTLRFSTTAADALRIGFWWQLGRWYQKHEMEATKLPPFEATPTSDYQTVEHAIEHAWPSRKWWELAVWSTLAWPLRMGHTLEAAGFKATFWQPLQFYAFSRVGALAIGAVPGCIGGVPSLTTSLCLGLAYAMMYRERLERNLESRMARARMDQGAAMFSDSGFGSSDWGYRLQTVLGYGYFTCFMVLWDAEVLGMVLAAEKEPR